MHGTIVKEGLPAAARYSGAADRLAKVVDGLGLTDQSSQGSQVVHRTVVEKGMILYPDVQINRGEANYLPAGVDRVGLTVRPAKGPQVVHGSVVEKGVELASRCVRGSDDPSAVVDAISVAGGSPECPQWFGGVRPWRCNGESAYRELRNTYDPCVTHAKQPSNSAVVNSVSSRNGLAQGGHTNRPATPFPLLTCDSPTGPNQHLENHAYPNARDALEKVLDLRPKEVRAETLLKEVERREQEHIRLRHEKQEAYKSALEAYQRGDLNSALNKLERVLDLDRRAPDSNVPGKVAEYQKMYEEVRGRRDLLASKELLFESSADRGFDSLRAAAVAYGIGAASTAAMIQGASPR
jgi:tetratricopeptide (TPR) repeat protein